MKEKQVDNEMYLASYEEAREVVHNFPRLGEILSQSYGFVLIRARSLNPCFFLSRGWRKRSWSTYRSLNWAFRKCPPGNCSSLLCRRCTAAFVWKEKRSESDIFSEKRERITCEVLKSESQVCASASTLDTAYLLFQLQASIFWLIQNQHCYRYRRWDKEIIEVDDLPMTELKSTLHFEANMNDLVICTSSLILLVAKLTNEILPQVRRTCINQRFRYIFTQKIEVQGNLRLLFTLMKSHHVFIHPKYWIFQGLVQNLKRFSLFLCSGILFPDKPIIFRELVLR